MEISKIQPVLIKAGIKKITRENMRFDNFKETKVHITVFCFVATYILVVVINDAEKNTISFFKIEPSAKLHEETIII